MKRFAFFCLVLLLIPSLSAQVPGYLGKKISLEYRPDLGINIRGAGTNNFLTLRNRLDVGYTIGRTMSLHLALDYNAIERYRILESERIFVNGIDKELSKYYYFQASRLGIGAYLAFYRKKSFGLAPLGRYYAIGVYNLLPTNSRFRYYTTDTLNNASEPIKSTEMPDVYKEYEEAKMRGMWSIGFTLGKRQLIAKQLLLDYGVNFYSFIPLYRNSSSSSNFERIQKEEIRSIIPNIYKFHSFLGVGILL